MKIVTLDFETYEKSIQKALDTIKAKNILLKQENILIKPNLVNASFHPITTSPDCVDAIIKYIRSFSNSNIIVAEGCGDADMETDEIFDILGYRKLRNNLNVELLDLNNAPLRKLTKPDCKIFKEIYLPEILFKSFIISVPVVKAHSLSTITGSLKNMIGVAPPKYYSGTYGIWKKAFFHNQIHDSITELNMYRSPDLTVMDASIGLKDHHLGGAQCEPVLNKIIAGYDPLEIDRKSADLLGLNWKNIKHLNSKY